MLLTDEQLRLLEARCVSTWPNETGGVLVGRYNESLDLALVTQLPEAPTDSQSGRSTFSRGVRGLRELFTTLWEADAGLREYYLGEWHFHPGQGPTPSRVDDERMHRIGRNPRYRCPEPVLLIVGGDADLGWSIGAYVYPLGGRSERLVLRD